MHTMTETSSSESPASRASTVSVCGTPAGTPAPEGLPSFSESPDTRTAFSSNAGPTARVNGEPVIGCPPYVTAIA